MNCLGVLETQVFSQIFLKFKLEFNLMKLESHRWVNKDNFETPVSIQHMALTDEFCD